MGNATLNGTLSLTLVGGYTGSAGDLFTIINAGTLTGTFSNLAVPLGYVFNLSYLPVQVDLSLVSVGVSPVGPPPNAGASPALPPAAMAASANSPVSNALIRELDRSQDSLFPVTVSTQASDPEPDDFMCRM